MNCSPIFLLLLMLMMTVESNAQTVPVTGMEWKIAASLPPAKGQEKALGLAGPVAGISEGVLLVAGGANFPDGMPWLGGKKKYHNEVFVFRNGRNDSLLPVASLQLPFTLAYAAVTSSPYGVVAAGGENENGNRNTAFLLQWIPAAGNIGTTHLPDLPQFITNASAVFHRNKIYVAGGETTTATQSGFFELDMANVQAGWQRLPNLPKPVSHSVMVVQTIGGEEGIYLIGGRKKNTGDVSELYTSTWVYNIEKATWRAKADLPYALSAGTGAAYGDSAILLFGGDQGETFLKTEQLIAAINREDDPVQKKRLNEQKIGVQSSHPGFCRQVLLYDTKKNNWKAIGCMPFEAPVTTVAVPWKGGVVIPSGEIKAGVRTPRILKGKIRVQ